MSLAELQQRVAELEDDLAATRSSLRHMIRDQSRDTTLKHESR
ncbi:hypothetical protein ACFTWS_34475 [Streptomyces sp. NPDC057027]